MDTLTHIAALLTAPAATYALTVPATAIVCRVWVAWCLRAWPDEPDPNLKDS